MLLDLDFNLFGCLGLVRFPDVYNRLQAATKCVTLGTCSILFGTLLIVGFVAVASSRIWMFVPWVTAMVGYWATLSLNIPDFTRYARSQRDQATPMNENSGIVVSRPIAWPVAWSRWLLA